MGRDDRKTAVRVLALVEAVLRDPASGIGKPERLKYLGSGVWSRRVTQEHRLVYAVQPGRIAFHRRATTTDPAEGSAARPSARR